LTENFAVCILRLNNKADLVIATLEKANNTANLISTQAHYSNYVNSKLH